LYAFGNESSDFVFWTHHLGPSGIVSSTGAQGLFSGFGVYFKCAGGRAFASSGTVVDLAGLRVVGQCDGPGLGIFTGGGYGTLVEPDTENGRIYFLVLEGLIWKLVAYDATTFQKVGDLSFPTVVGGPTSLTRWGSDGLAFRTSGGQIFLCSRSRIGGANLSITSVSAPSVGLGASLAYTVTITNRGPHDAREVTLTEQLPTSSSFVTGYSATATCVFENGAAICRFGLLPVGFGGSATVVVTPSLAGVVANAIQLTTSDFDPDQADNSVTSLTAVTNATAPGWLVAFSAPVQDIAYNPSSQRLLGSVQSGANAIIDFDPQTGGSTNVIPLGSPPGQLALADSGRFLYTALVSTGGVGRIDLAANRMDLAFPLGVGDRFGIYTAGDLKAVPGLERSVAVSINHGGNNARVAVFDDALERANAVAAREFGGTYPIGFGSSGSILYSTLPNDLRTISVDAAGARLVTDTSDLVPGYDTVFEFNAGRLYFQSGRVVDPVAMQIVGQFPAAGPLAVDAAAGRVYFLTGSGFAPFNWQLTMRAFDLATTNELWSVPLPVASGYATRVINMGTNGLVALTDAQRLIIVRTSELASPAADLSLTQVASSDTVSAGTAISYILRVGNQGPWTASGILVSNPLPANSIFLSATSSQGSCLFTNGALLCSLGTLANEATATVTLNLKSTATGAITNVAIVSGNEGDSDPANNSTTLTTTVVPLSGLSVADATAVQNPNSVAFITFLLSLSSPSSAPVSVSYRTADGTAVAGQDYDSASGTVTIPAGVTERQLSLRIIRNSPSAQPASVFYLNLSAVTNAVLTRAQATGTIIQRVFRSVAISGTAVSVSQGSQTNALFKISLSQAGSLPVVVDYQTLDGTARAGLDYEPKAGSLIFPAGTNSLILSVPVFGESVWTTDKSFSVLLSRPQNATLSVDEAVGVIHNSTPAPPRLDFSFSGGSLVLSWPVGAALQTATNVTGPYFNLPEVTSPYTNPGSAGLSWFFRTIGTR
jgi:uncharacterized repeat protein (TIGR01451 family)